MSLRVAYFANQFADRHGHGLARYARELHTALAALDGVEITPVAAWSTMPADELSALKQATGLRTLPTGRQITRLDGTFLGALPIEMWLKGCVDITHAVALGYPVATRRPLVVTIHDLGPLTHPQFFSNTRPWVMQRALDQAVRQASAIICVSHSTAAEVREVCGPVVDDRLRVIHEGVGEEFSEPVDPACLTGLDLPPAGTPFILAAGKLSPRKNVQGIIAALCEVLDDIPHHLVLTGGSGWDMETITAELGDPRLAERVHFTGYVSDRQLRALYGQAAIYVHPSLYEGFGLTVLEAMAAGTPVITADRSSLPEVAGGAARLVDPEDTAALAGALRDIGTDPTLAADLTARGKANASRFAWSITAAETAEVYRAAAT
ncbi:MAG: glycosyltransferase family 1 protein [Pseudomonadota bacterium]